mmetsp:Transcript_18666/g.40008  ORF Transcript_18666/g.40008 Transcript_18666/m.40008 type:complete len:224 (-) Transcript_18666:197-868(-)
MTAAIDAGAARAEPRSVDGGTAGRPFLERILVLDHAEATTLILISVLEQPVDITLVEVNAMSQHGIHFRALNLSVLVRIQFLEEGNIGVLLVLILNSRGASGVSWSFLVLRKAQLVPDGNIAILPRVVAAGVVFDGLRKAQLILRDILAVVGGGLVLILRLVVLGLGLGVCRQGLGRILQSLLLLLGLQLKQLHIALLVPLSACIVSFQQFRGQVNLFGGQGG